MLLSTISDPVGANVDLNQILYMNGINGEHQYQTLDQVSQILNIPSLPTNTEFYSREEFQKQRSVSVSISSPESGIGSEYNDTAAISPGTAVDFTNQPVSSVRSLSNRIAFSPSDSPEMFETQDYYEYDKNNEDNIAVLLQQLTNESNELLADSENDLVRFEHVKNAYRTSTEISPSQSSVITSVISSPPVLSLPENPGSVFITGPNHRGTIYNNLAPTPAPRPQQSVIVRNVQAVKPVQVESQHPRTYTNENYSVDFSTIPIPNVISQNTFTPIVVDTAQDDTNKEDRDIFQNFEISPKKDTQEYMCYVCGEKAGKHSYYGGQVCASCRAFFRRSVQSKYYEIFQCKIDKHCIITSKTRKTCQFCRFKKCLEAGMKPSWVLSDEERNRRFNKFNKLQIKSSNSDPRLARKSANIRVPELYITFTMEEQKLIGFIKNKMNFCQQSWLRNLLNYDRGAGINMIEAAYKLAPLSISSFKTMQKACHIYFANKVLPTFINLDTMHSDDQAAIMTGKNSSVSHFFKVSQCLKLHRTDPLTVVKNETEMCPIQRQVAEIASNHEMVESYDLSQILSRRNLLPVAQFPTYQDIFAPGWTARDNVRDTAKDVEFRHEQIMRQIQSWPFDETQQFDHTMLLLMCLVLLFSTDLSAFRKAEVVEQTQMKYTTLLQRYLKSKMSPKAANKKFLDAIMLISATQELWDINEKYLG